MGFALGCKRGSALQAGYCRAAAIVVLPPHRWTIDPERLWWTSGRHGGSAQHSGAPLLLHWSCWRDDCFCSVLVGNLVKRLLFMQQCLPGASLLKFV